MKWCIGAVYTSVLIGEKLHFVSAKIDIFRLALKGSAGVLKPSVSVEQRMCVRISLNSLVKGFVDKRVVIAFAEHIGHNAPVTEVLQILGGVT